MGFSAQSAELVPLPCTPSRQRNSKPQMVKDWRYRLLAGVVYVSK